MIVKAEAHAKMWEKAIPVTTNFMPGWSVSPAPAAGEAAYFHSQTGGNVLDYAMDGGPGVAAITGAAGGLMGESYSRVKPVDIVENIGDANEQVTYRLNEDYIIEENDSISYDLMNDAVNFSPGGGGGALGMVNNLLSFAGARPAIAAGVRYGISGDFSTKQVQLFGGQMATFEARSHVANAPRPTSRYITVAMVRLAMTKQDEYDTAIKFDVIPDISQAFSTALDWAKSFANPFKGGKRKKKKKNQGRDLADQLLNVIPCRGSLCGR